MRLFVVLVLAAAALSAQGKDVNFRWPPVEGDDDSVGMSLGGPPGGSRVQKRCDACTQVVQNFLKVRTAVSWHRLRG